MADSVAEPAPLASAASSPRSPWFVPALVFALVFPTIATWLYFIQFAGTAAVKVFYGVGKAAQFAFPLVYAGLVEGGIGRFELPQYGKPTRWRLAPSVAVGFGFGLAVFIAILSLYFGALQDTSLFAALPGQVRAKLVDAGAATPARFALLAIFYCVIHSLLEEYYWRWFVYRRLRLALSEWPANLISSLGFMSHHTLVIGLYFGGFTPLTVLLSLGVALGGVAWAWLYERSGSLYGSWLSHLLVDAALMLIGYNMIWGGA